MSRYRATHAEHLRLALLRLLERAPGRSANDAVLRDALAALGFRASRDLVRATLAWLAEHDLVALEPVGHLTVATATERGADVAEGLALHPGVRRPEPDA